ncbi:MAG: hypothetical protein KGJ02_02450 [Verrucomicrobiota bacterium]|nr:hypothetical protein [Verrucomicrobiota bacterium]
MQLFFYFLFLLFAWQGESLSRPNLPDPASSIGVRTLIYQDEARKRPVVVELWYPLNQRLSLENQGEDVWIHPRESRNAPLSSASKHYPLILMSHGHGGSRRDQSWLAEAFVKADFIVASIDHYGNTQKTMNPILTLQFWDRAKDVSFALDSLLHEPFLLNHIDEKRIGFTGYSLGGMTGLALAGAVADQIQDAIAKHSPHFSEIPKDALSQVDFSPAVQNFRDPRIKALLLIAPANFVYRPSTLEKIDVPIGLVSAINDEVLPHKDHSYPIIQHVVPVKLKVLNREVSHFAFLNSASEMGKKLLPARFQTTYDRSKLHREIGDFATRFFKDTLH